MKEKLQDARAGSNMAYDAETKGSGGKDNEKQLPAGKGWLKRWRPRLPIILGGLLALAVLSVWGAKATLANTDRPEYCLGCHVMENHYESWFHSAHQMAVTCSDCHVPHQNTAAMLVAKGIDGMRDSYL
ncbi:MAG: NapC/NirT family cytochrome c, partial [Candidatus Desulforudis sp.]|nr:NapC/NirT family cytochrome c [Desulforudis sp.]